MNQKHARQICDLLNAHNELSRPLRPSQIINTKRKYCTILDNDNVIACAAIRKRSWYQSEVLHVSVSPTRRREGHAKALLKQLESVATTPILQCTIKHRNTHSWKLFLNCGWIAVNAFTSRYSNETIFILQKQL